MWYLLALQVVAGVGSNGFHDWAYSWQNIGEFTTQERCDNALTGLVRAEGKTETPQVFICVRK